MAAIMELLEMLIRQVMEIKVWSVNSIGAIERMEQIDDGVNFLNDEKECVVANHYWFSSSSSRRKSRLLEIGIWELRHFFEIKMMEDLNLMQSIGGMASDMHATTQHLHLAGATHEELKVYGQWTCAEQVYTCSS
ncbi:hypothetical protein HAX54_017956 [Datura stramonium]|uniref:Uncharacterized protein n=1 Tax=Datura stramonium TaxID=4076 RepID=A0ABS8UNK5_DATST|nr:hypothetical protein [Datura stramonium]